MSYMWIQETRERLQAINLLSLRQYPWNRQSTTSFSLEAYYRESDWIDPQFYGIRDQNTHSLQSWLPMMMPCTDRAWAVCRSMISTCIQYQRQGLGQRLIEFSKAFPDKASQGHIGNLTRVPYPLLRNRDLG